MALEALRKWLLGAPPPAPAPPSAETHDDRQRTEAIETAWRIHAAVVAWTASVDQKASFALAIESAVLVAAGGFTKKGSLFGNMNDRPELFAYYGGIAVLSLALICAGSVVKPRLRGRKTGDEWADNFIYFGHLRHWNSSALVDKLKGADMLEMLSKQLVAMSGIAWRKHRSVQVSLYLALLGFTLLAAAAWFSH